MNLAYQYVSRSSMTEWTFEFLRDLVKANKSVIIIEIEAMPHHKFS